MSTVAVTSALDQDDLVAIGHLKEIFAEQIKAFQELLGECRSGDAFTQDDCGVAVVDQLVAAYHDFPFELTWPWWVDESEGWAPGIVYLSYEESRSIKIAVGTRLAEEVRKRPYNLNEPGGPYYKMRALIVNSNTGLGFGGFQMSDLGVSYAEQRQWDMSECAYNDMLLDSRDADPYEDDDILYAGEDMF